MKLKRIKADSVSDALVQGINLLYGGDSHVREEDSRNGKVRTWDGPVVTHSRHPLRRVLFSAKRNANPFFHLFEALWMLGGRNDLPWLAQFNKQMKTYSDDGGSTQPAAYGHRWRKYFGYDQIAAVIEELRRDPGTRRAVLGMWDAWGIHQVDEVHQFGDLHGAMNGGADVPCNTECYFTLRDGKLNMSVQCRSNDVLWGAHGANAVHFSILLEYIAAAVGAEAGEMFQYSWNYHIYEGILKWSPQRVINDLWGSDRYTLTRKSDRVGVTPIFFDLHSVTVFDEELPSLLDWMDPTNPDAGGWRSKPALSHVFLERTVVPMFEAWRAHKDKDYSAALGHCDIILGTDWRIASTEWMQRRERVL